MLADAVRGLLVRGLELLRVRGRELRIFRSGFMEDGIRNRASRGGEDEIVFDQESWRRKQLTKLEKCCLGPGGDGSDFEIANPENGSYFVVV